MTVEPTELKTERLLLRPYKLRDVDDVLAYRTDEEWARFLPHIPQPYTRSHAEQFVAQEVLRSWEKSPWVAIELSGRVVGCVGIDINIRNSLGALGYFLARKHWGKGVAVEATRAFVGWAFSAYDLAKVYAQIDERNVRSVRVAEKLGMTREGLLKSHHAARDGRSDDVVYGILREQWRADN